MIPLPALLRALAVWALMMLAESLQGQWRSAFLEAQLGTERAGVVGMAVAILVVLLITFASIRWIGLKGGKVLLTLGFLWVALTLVFEVALGLALGFDWMEIAAGYDLRHGGLMPVGLLIMLLAPLLAARIRGGAPRPRSGPGAWHKGGA